MLVVLVAVALAASSLVINEVLYDPEGADGALEFVEIAATAGTDPDASLAGWTLETGNGARPGEWTAAWVGAAADRLHAGLFVVGESAVEPRPDAVVDLDLQNGPDACRLRGPSGETDLVGWGAPLDPSFFEGEAAADPNGLSLARLPDGFDTDRNAADFLTATPSPGEFNAAEKAVVVERFASPVDEAGHFEWGVRNVGRIVSAARVSAVCAVHEGETLAAAESAPLSPGERAVVTATAAAPAGIHLPRSEPAAPGAGGPWAGAGTDLVIGEVMNRPLSGDPEWIEVESASPWTIDLGALEIEDASGSGGALHGSLSPFAFAVLTSDSAAVAARWSVPATVRVVEVSPWPALNHTSSAGASVAERVVLLVDSLSLETGALPTGAREGISWERLSRWLPGEDPAAWSLCADVLGGTPGRVNSTNGERGIPAGVAGTLAAHPSPFAPDRDGAVLVVLRADAVRDRCVIRVYDSWGSHVADLAPWRAGGEHRALWTGRDAENRAAPLGLYVLRAEAAGMRPARTTVALVR
ncbi:MAG: hypothetical protein ACT4PE_18125 [Candidatus Eiseniibacteriota bacterium]